MIRFHALPAMLMMGACSQAPTPVAEPQVVVVAGSTHAPAIPPGVLAAPATATPPAIRPTAPAKLMTIEESAQVHTSEMWSEPITPAT